MSINRHSVWGALSLSALLISQLTHADQYQLMMPISGIKAAPPAFQGESCKAILEQSPESASGVYTISPTAGNVLDVYCDMTSQGGGWTMIVAQYEHDIVTDWNEGVQADYDPTLTSKRGFALNSAQIPSHTQIGFGKDLDSTFIEYVDFTYTTQNIATTLLMGRKNNVGYHISRNDQGLYMGHNPEETFSNGSSYRAWFNALVLDGVGGRKYNWSFSPMLKIYAYSGHHYSYSSGYGMAGTDVSKTVQDYAWTVWVR